MQMLQSDWLSYSYIISHTVAAVVHEMRCCYSFAEVLEESLGVNS